MEIQNRTTKNWKRNLRVLFYQKNEKFVRRVTVSIWQADRLLFFIKRARLKRKEKEILVLRWRQIRRQSRLFIEDFHRLEKDGLHATIAKEL